jgi:hypothetical protein
MRYVVRRYGSVASQLRSWRPSGAIIETMPRKPAAPKPDNPEQYKRFLETAREVGADEPGEAFDSRAQSGR